MPWYREPWCPSNVGDRSLDVRRDVDEGSIGTASLGACRNVGEQSFGVRRDIDERCLGTASFGARWDVDERRLGVRRDVNENHLGTPNLGDRKLQGVQESCPALAFQHILEEGILRQMIRVQNDDSLSKSLANSLGLGTVGHDDSGPNL